MSGSPRATLAALPLVRRGASGPERVLELSLEAPAAAAACRLVVSADGREAVHEIGPVPAGASTFRVAIPEPAVGTRVSWSLRTAGGSTDGSRSVEPARPWRVSLVHFSHHDIGYTDLPSVAARQHLDYLDRVVAYCDETAAYPVEARFRWTLDTAWPLPEWLASRPDAVVRRFLSLVREGRVDLSALFVAFNAGLPDLEELVRSISFACELRRRHRVPVRGAVTTDVPGHPWALVPVLARSGIRYLTTSVNALYEQGGIYRALEPRTPKPFRWIGPDGSEVLVWNTGPGANYGSEGRDLGFYEDLAAVERRLPAGLLALEGRGYAYDAVSFRVGTDNRPPDRSLSDLVRAWNERYRHPTLMLDTASGFLAGLEAGCRGEFAAVRGDWTDWWLDGPASSARETALSRETRERLLAVGAAMGLGRLGGVPPVDDEGPAALSAAYDRLMLYDEHTWGAWDSALAPDSPDVRHHWLQKAVHVYAAERSSRELLDGALGALAAGAAGADRPSVAVFNPCSWPRTEPVLAVIPDALVGGAGCPFRLVDRATGGETAFQTWSRIQFWEWRRETTIAFVAADVPAFGVRVYDLVPAGPRSADAPRPPAARAVADGARVRAVPDGLENDRLRVVFDRATGAVASLRDLALGRELVDPSAGCCLGQYLYDAGERPGSPRFAPAFESFGDPEIGPVFARLRSQARCEMTPSIALEAVLWAGIGRLDLSLAVEKNETLAKECAYVAFPLAVPGGSFLLDVPGAAMRPGLDQIAGSCTSWYAARRWIDVDSPSFGVLWAGRDVPVVSLGGIGTGRLDERFEQRGTGIFAYAMNNAWDTNFKESQGGRFRFRFSLRPHDGPHDPRAAHEFGAAACAPMPCAALPPTRGRDAAGVSPSSGPEPFLRLEGEGVICESLVPAADGRGAIVRLREIAGRAAAAVIALPRAGIGEARLASPVGDDGERLEVRSGRVSVGLGPRGFADVRIIGAGDRAAPPAAAPGGTA